MGRNDGLDTTNQSRTGFSTLAVRAWGRGLQALSPRCPYRVGDAVLGDDPFSGRRVGVVASQRGTSVGVDTPAGLYFYDHRQVRKLG